MKDGPHPLAGTEPMEAKLVEALPAEDGWQYEPKWDGFRAIASRLRITRLGRRRFSHAETTAVPLQHE